MQSGSYRLSLIAIATIATLVLGLWFGPWFRADEAPPDAVAFDATRPLGTAEIKLLQVNVCHANAKCASASAGKLVDGTYPDLAIAIFATGVVFGLMVLWADRKRVSEGSHRWRWCIAALAFGALLLALSVICLALYAPDSIGYEIAERRFGSVGERVFGETTLPSLAWGGFVTIAGTLMGLVTIWRARPVSEPIAAPSPRAPRRPDIAAPPRGVETDPFRAPPEPPPLALVRHERPAPVPRADSSEDAPGPKLLR